MYSRLLSPPAQQSFFLFGPRGTGKTTWVKSTFPRALYIDLLKADTYTFLVANPGRIEEVVPEGFDDWVIIDEIQKIPQLLDEVHRLMEDKHYKFILTGSSARTLRRGGVNLLAGRARMYHLHPLTANEMGGDFKLNHYLQYGGLPGVWTAEDKTDFLKSYVQTYIQQEVIQEGISRNLGAFARFLETASFSQGSVLNMSEVAREAAVGRRVAENYFSALEDLLIGVRLPVFSKKAKRKLVSHGKFYFFDTGVYRAIRPVGPFDQPEFIAGIALESVLFQHLRAVNEYYNLGYNLFYWRTAAGSEVDFVAYGKRGIKAFEVKRKKKIFSSDVAGVKSFLADYPSATGYVLYGGSMKRHLGDIDIWPMTEALKSLPELLA